MASNDVIAPFVMKTYQMVNDSSSDNLIPWGNTNNSFIVVDSLHFSQTLLLSFFKHSNFLQLHSPIKYLRFQINRFEQMRIRKRVRTSAFTQKHWKETQYNYRKFHQDDEEDMIEMSIEITKLKQEQNQLENEMLVMKKRLEATEKRPEQIMALLCLVTEDPQILPRMMFETEQKRLMVKKWQRSESGGDDGVEFGSSSEDLDVEPRLPYPFSLLGGGF